MNEPVAFSALATTIARFAALGPMVWFILRQPDPRGAVVTALTRLGA